MPGSLLCTNLTDILSNSNRPSSWGSQRGHQRWWWCIRNHWRSLSTEKMDGCWPWSVTACCAVCRGIRVEGHVKAEETSWTDPHWPEKISGEGRTLTNTLEEMGNPFQEETEDLLSLDTKDIASPDSAAKIATHLFAGKASFEACLEALE